MWHKIGRPQRDTPTSPNSSWKVSELLRTSYSQQGLSITLDSEYEIISFSKALLEVLIIAPCMWFTSQCECFHCELSPLGTDYTSSSSSSQLCFMFKSGYLPDSSPKYGILLGVWTSLEQHWITIEISLRPRENYANEQGLGAMVFRRYLSRPLLEGS